MMQKLVGEQPIISIYGFECKFWIHHYNFNQIGISGK